MKYKINSMSLLVLFLMGMISFSFMACSDSNSSGGQPEITGVKILSSDTLNYSYDEYYTKAGPGTMIAIEGKNLGGALKVFINGQELTFNTTMNTDHSIIVTIPTEEKGFKLSAFDDVPDEIRVETHGGVATYEFKVTAPGPQLQRVQALYPREAGDDVILHGLNLVDIEEAYFSDVTAAHLDTTEWSEIGGNHVAIGEIETLVKDHHLSANNTYVTTSQLHFTMPSVPYDEGVIVLECASGITYIPYYRVPGKPEIISVNTDMPIVGTDLIIKGREFVQVESIKYGDVTLTSDDFTVAETEDEIVIPFAKKPSAGSGSTLTVVTPGGEATYSDFFAYDGLLLTFEDGVGNDNGWSPKGVVMNEATDAAIPYISDGKFYRINSSDGGWNWWATMCYYSYKVEWVGDTPNYTPFPLPGYDVIPASASTDDVYLAMEVWDNNTDFGGAQYPFLHYQIQTIGDAKTLVFENFIQNDVVYKEKALRAIDNSQPKEQWYRHVVKLSNFDGWAGKTYGDVVADGINQIRLMHMNWNGAPSKMDIMFDNVRLIYVPTKK